MTHPITRLKRRLRVVLFALSWAVRAYRLAHGAEVAVEERERQMGQQRPLTAKEAERILAACLYKEGDRVKFAPINEGTIARICISPIDQRIVLMVRPDGHRASELMFMPEEVEKVEGT